jgi:hypothetical protein
MTGFLGVAISDTTEKVLIVGAGILIFATLAWLLRSSRLKNSTVTTDTDSEKSSSSSTENHHSYQSTLESTDGDVLDDYNMSRRKCHKKKISQTR